MAYANALAALLLVVCALHHVSAAKLPATFINCKQSNPKFNQCLATTLEKVIKERSKFGSPSLGVPKVDPLVISSLDIDNGNGKSPLNLELHFKNLNIHGFSNAKIKSIQSDVKNIKYSGKIEVDGPINLLADYSVNGKVLLLPITGKGKCNITLVNPKVELRELTGKLVKKGKESHVQVVKFKFVVTDMDKLVIKLDNLFNGNKALGDNMNQVLNDNWREVLNELKPPIQEALGVAFQSITNSFFAKVPYDEVFPA